MTPPTYTTCQYPECAATLGQESRDLAYPFCHDHRKCHSCSQSLSARECQGVMRELGIEETPLEASQILHPRCSTLVRRSGDQDPSVLVKQSYLDYLNNIRLMIEPDFDLCVDTNENTAMLFSERLVSGMTFEQKCVHLRMLEACVAHTSIAVRKDPAGRKIKDQLEQLDKRARAKQESLTSSRPTTKSIDDPVEIALAKFMQKHGITERKVGLKIQRDRKNAIHGLMVAGLSEESATELIDKELVKKGILKG